jgi:hypothetical protein
VGHREYPLFLSRKSNPPIRILRVHPGTGVLLYSQTLMPKKKVRQVAHDVVVSVVCLPSADQVQEEGLEQSWRYCLLYLHRGVYVFVGPEEASKGREKLFSPFDMEGTPDEATPQRRSHAACGSFDSGRYHPSLTDANHLP